MNIFGTEITKEMMPSYQVGQNYPTRRYQFMQDTINNALQGQVMAAQQQQTQAQQQPIQGVN